jgi:hypothetical protein
MKQQAALLILAALAISIAGFTPVGSHQCGELRESTLKPLDDVREFLKTAPSAELLSGPGCNYVLKRMQELPRGAELVRLMAMRNVENSSVSCLDRMNSIHYVCGDAVVGDGSRCLPQTYS